MPGRARAFNPHETSFNGPHHVAVNCIRAETELFSDRINRADFQTGKNVRLEQQSISASRSRPRNRQGLTPMLRTPHAWHIGFNLRGELAGIRVPAIYGACGRAQGWFFHRLDRLTERLQRFRQ